METKNTITAVLAGNPNCGKTTLFNALTGSNQHTGNWSGVTVEKKYGDIKNSYGYKIHLVDLPGIYSMQPYSPEEKVSTNYLLHNKPDIIINIVDATNLERNLYLTTQLAELDIPMIVALNMYDIVNKNGDKIDTHFLNSNFNALFVPISAGNGMGFKDLISGIIKISENGKNKRQNKFKSSHCSSASERYKYIESIIVRAVTYSHKRRLLSDISSKIDKIVTHRIFAIPVFILIIAIIFYITFGPFGQLMKNCTEYIINYIIENCVKSLLICLNTSDIIQSLVLDGIIAGVVSVISFLPQIAVLFTLLSALEGSGYMARAVFITDRLLRCIGLSGKSFVPVIMSFGCTVPAVLSTRTLEDEKEKQTALMISPFMSCSAKMPVYVLFTSTFFGKNSAIVIFFIYILGIAVAVITSLLFKDSNNKNTNSFIIEMPPYHLPSAKSLMLHTWERVREFLVRAGTVLLISSVVIWFLQNFDFHLQAVNESQSMLSQLGKIIAPIFSVCGFASWQASVSLLTGITAKESVASTLSVLFSKTGLESSFNPLSAFSFLCFVLLYPPCIAATTAIYNETKSLRKTAFSIGYQLFAAWLVSALIYQSGTLLINILY